jgi:hypothetical protein
MATVPMLAGVGLMVVCSSSIAAFMMMGGEEETPDPVIGAGPSAADYADLDEDATADDDAPDCSAAQTDWINGNMKSKGFSQGQGESLQKCKVPANLQSRIEDITYCDVAKTDWINNQIKQADRRNTFEQASSLQNCVVPHNLRSRITNESCSVSQTDWINSKMGNDDWSQDQGEAAQKCFVPNVYKGRITN